MTKPKAAPGTVLAFGDVMGGWMTLALHRFHAARTEAGLHGPLLVVDSDDRSAIPDLVRRAAAA